MMNGAGPQAFGLSGLGPQCLVVEGFGSKARFRVLNASPGVPSLDVHTNGARAFSSVSYGQLTDYVPVAAGQRTIRIYPAGRGEGEPLVDLTINLRGDTEYTVATVGQAGEVEVMVLKDTTPPAAPGRVRIRMVHLAPGARPVDVVIKGGVDIFRNVAYREVTGFAEVEAGTVDLEFIPAGADSPLLTVQNYHLSPGGKYTLVVLGRREGAPAFSALPVEDRAGLRM